MLHLDDRAAQVYADMHSDLEAERVGYRAPVYHAKPSRWAERYLRLRAYLHRQAFGRERGVEQRARHTHPQEQCC